MLFKPGLRSSALTELSFSQCDIPAPNSGPPPINDEADDADDELFILLFDKFRPLELPALLPPIDVKPSNNTVDAEAVGRLLDAVAEPDDGCGNGDDCNDDREDKLFNRALFILLNAPTDPLIGDDDAVRFKPLK